MSSRSSEIVARASSISSKEKSDAAAILEPSEEATTKESVISKATNGIKSFLGGIGDNVSGITNLVSNTASIANGYLTKKIIRNFYKTDIIFHNHIRLMGDDGEFKLYNKQIRNNKNIKIHS